MQTLHKIRKDETTGRLFLDTFTDDGSILTKIIKSFSIKDDNTIEIIKYNEVEPTEVEPTTVETPETSTEKLTIIEPTEEQINQANLEFEKDPESAPFATPVL